MVTLHCSFASSVLQGHGVLPAKNVDKNVEERDEDGKKLELERRNRRIEKEEEGRGTR